MARYQTTDVDQNQMVMLNYGELFSEEHPTRKLLELIRKLDLSEFDNNYTNDTDKGGRPAFPVDRLLAILFYSLLHGNISMRNLERDLHQRADLLFLSGGLKLEHSVISIFRRRHASAIENLFSQTVFLGSEAGLIDFDMVCIDSTKLKANANSRDIGTKAELEHRYKYIKNACKVRYAEWSRCEDEEEKKILERKRTRLDRQEKRIREGLSFLEQHHVDKPHKRVHLTDKEADYHKTANGFIIGYNAHLGVDAKHGMIVTQNVVTEKSDSEHTVSLVEDVEAKRGKTGTEAEEATKYILDAGYSSENNLAALKDKDVYMPDREYVTLTGAKTKPEDRDKSDDFPDLVFTYNKEADSYSCPRGKVKN